MLQLSNTAHDTVEEYPGAPLVAFQKLPLLLARLSTWGLLLDISLTGMADDSVFTQLNGLVAQNTRDNNVVWACRPGSSSSATTVEREYSDGPFIVLRQGKVSTDKMFHTLAPFNSPTYGITNAKLCKTLNKFRHPSIPNFVMLAICM